jgi:hypothetical protein
MVEYFLTGVGTTITVCCVTPLYVRVAIQLLPVTGYRFPGPGNRHQFPSGFTAFANALNGQ